MPVLQMRDQGSEQWLAQVTQLRSARVRIAIRAEIVIICSLSWGYCPSAKFVAIFHLEWGTTYKLFYLKIKKLKRYCKKFPEQRIQGIVIWGRVWESLHLTPPGRILISIPCLFSHLFFPLSNSEKYLMLVICLYPHHSFLPHNNICVLALSLMKNKRLCIFQKNSRWHWNR